MVRRINGRLLWLSGIALVALAVAMPAAAQSTGMVKGVVKDASGQPVEGAKVILIASANPHPIERGREVKMTDANGLAEFDSRHEWRMETLMIHGVEFFFWNWCVEKHGFKTYRTYARSSGDEFDQHATIRLSRGASSDCPEKTF